MKNMIKKSFICAFAALATLVASAFDTPYLTFRSAASFSLSATKRWDGTLQKATSNPTDEASWSDWTGSSISAGLSDGQYYIYLRGKDNTHINSSSGYGSPFTLSGATADLYCEGDIETLRDYEGNPPDMETKCYAYLFNGWTRLVSPPAMSATTLAEDCYRNMFEGCTALKSIPALPATTAPNRCYYYMFKECTSLEINTTAPGVEWAIPSGTVGTSIWNYDMFANTSGSFTGNPVAGTTYYVASALPFGEIYQIAGKGTLDLELVGFSANLDLASTVKNGTAPYTFAHVGGTLPPGLEVSGSTLSGMPTTAGNYAFSLSVTDSESHTPAVLNYTMQVVQPTVTATTFVGADGLPITTNCITLTTAMTTLNQEWYAASGMLNYGTGGIKVSGNVNLVLADGASVTVQGASKKAGVNVATGNSLTIYGQTAGTGALNASGNSSDGFELGGAGIGGNDKENAGTVTINGGTINATGSQYTAAGIGGGKSGNGGTVTINGGTVTAIGGIWYGAGIGGGQGGNGGNVTINGGTVTATAGSQSAGTANAATGIGRGYGYGPTAGTLTVGPSMSVKAGTTANPTEEIGRGGFITIGTQQYFFVETAGLAQETSVFAAYANELKNWDLADTISGGTTPYSFTPVVGFEPPSGLELSGTTLSGSVAVADTYTIKYTVTDSSDTPLVLEAVYTLTVTAPDPITETQTSLSATVGKSKSFTLADTISGGVPSYTFALASGSNAPDGFSLTDGVLSGTAASAVASYSFTVVVTDSLGTTKNVTYTFSAAESTGFTDDDPEEPASGDSVSCRTADGMIHQRTCNLLTSSSTVWDNSWYYVAPNTALTIPGVVVNGKVSLILGDGATLTVQGASSKAGIRVAVEGAVTNSLTIYAQSAGTGKLVAKGGSAGAGIGGDNRGGSTGSGLADCGKVTIYGGVIEATGSGDAAGIGGGDWYGKGGTVAIYGGTVTASAGSNAAGVGRGYGGSTDNGTLTVGERILVKAGDSANPTTVLDHGEGGIITLSSQKYFTFETTGPTPLTQTVNAFAAYVGQAFEQALSATVSGGTPTYSFVQKSGTLPTGLTFADGTISGTPTVGGSVTVVFTVTDSGVGADNQSEDFSYTITVTQPPKSITYVDSRDGTTELTGLVPAQYTPGTEATLPATATAPTGYNFGGWYATAECTGDAVTTVSASETENKTYYAKWTPIVYTVTYMTDTTTPITDQGLVPTSYTIESETLTLPASATKAGKGFYGWYDNSACSGSAVTTIPTGSTGNKIFYAKWGAEKVNTAYVDAAGNAMPQQLCAVVTSETTTLESGWYVVNADVTINGKVTISGNVNLILADGATLTVSSSVSGGSIDLKGANTLTIYGQENGTGALIASKVADTSGPAIGSTDNANPCGTLTINGGTITATGNSAGIGGGWNMPGGTIVINGGTVTANAGWGAAAIGGAGNGNGGSVTINGGRVIANGGESGGAGIGGGRSASSQGTLTVGPKVLVKAGASANPETVLERGAGGAITLSGQQYFTTETLVLSQAESELAAYAGEAFELSLVETISGGVPAYSFSGLTPNNLGLTLTSGGLLSGTLAAGVYNLALTVTDTESTSINANYTLTVSIRPKSITYKDGNDTIDGLSPTQYTPGTATALAASASKTGYNFVGWYDNDGLAGDPVTTVAASETENKTYWAKWTPIAYSITYMDGATPMDGLTPTTYTIEAAATLPETATKAGYGFYGWFVDSSCTGSAVTTIPAGQTGNKTFYAKWGVIKVPANYVDENGDPQTAQCVEIDSSTTTLETGWYVVNGEVTMAGYITVSGNVRIILADDANIVIPKPSDYKAGIVVAVGNSLTIYSQSAGTGRLEANGGSISAGIGGSYGQDCGTVTINGGVVVAKGDGGAGIGGGYDHAGGTVTVNGGDVTVSGGSGSGIGGGAGSTSGAGGDVFIYGGTVKATGGYSSAGIGGYTGAFQGTLTVGANIVVKAGSSENPNTVLDHGIGGVITLGGQRYFTTEVSGPVPLNQTSAALAAYAGEAFELSLTGTIAGGVPAYTFSGLTPDNLGLTLTGEGTLSGTLAAGVYNLALTVTDSELSSINASYTLTVSNRPKSITYKDGEATINGLTPTQYTPGTATTLAASATKTGYTFAGWYTNAELAGDPVTTVPASETEDKTYWAKWTAVNYAITYYEDSTTPMAGLVPATYTIEAAVSLPATATKTGGYAFLGWYDNSGLAGDAVTEIPAGQTGAKSFYAKWGEASVNANYIDENGDPQSAECTVITSSATTLNAGWYVVNSDVSINHKLEVSGEVNIILADGACLTVTGDQYQPGIKVTGDNTLRIYGQTGGTGRLEATGNSVAAGIGGGSNTACGTVVINGGVVVANGPTGIGGGIGGAGGTITINGGTVTATGASGAGIGGGYNGAGGTVTINGGTVVAEATSSGAGIGGGGNGNGATVTITGGTVTATGGYNAAGIGGGQNATDQGSLTVGENIIVKAGASANPTAELEHGAGGAITLSGETYFKVVTQTPLAQATAALAATDGSAFELSLAETISGGREPYTFSGLTPDNLGLTLTGSGTLSGTLAVGEYNFTVTVTDTESTEIEASYTLTVTYAPRRITYCIGIDPILGHAPSTYTPGVGATLQPYEREGYTFNGWYTDIGLEDGPVTAISAEETSDKILYGKWTANTSGVPVTFIDADGSERTETCDVLTTETTTLADGGWYVVNTALNYGSYNGLTVSGTANLVIADGASLTVQGGVNKAGIAVHSGSTLNIFAQANGTGTISATGVFGAGIGGDSTDPSCGTIAINGGNITAVGDTASGIGGGNNGAGGTVTINRATVVATGGNSGAGIGGGNHGAGGTVTINNSSVTATGGSMGAGIGGGAGAAGGDVIVNSGSVAATGGNMACGIGAGAGNYTYGTLKIGAALAAKAGASAEPETEFYANENGYVTFNSTYQYCTVTASGATPYVDVDGSEKAARCRAVSSSVYQRVVLDEEWYVVEGDVTVQRGMSVSGNVKLILADGASLTVTQDHDSWAGISVTNVNSLTIYGQSAQSGVLSVTGGYNAAGMGGDNRVACGTITVNGGVVTVQGGQSGAGIGGGKGGNGGTIVVNRGTVTVTGGSSGAGIGGGESGSAGTITINGGTVTADGGEFASAIGGGLSGNGGTVTVNGGSVTAAGGAYGGTAIGKGSSGSDNGSLTVVARMLIKTGTTQDSLAIVNPAVEAETLTPDGKRYCTIAPAEMYAIAYIDDDDTTLLEGLEPSQYVAGVGATLPETALKNGCVFDGWYATASRTDPVTAIPADATGPQVVYAKWIYATNISYVDASGEAHEGFCRRITADSERALAAGWYYVAGEVSLDSGLTVSGDVTLILADDAKLTVQGAAYKAGITVTNGCSLTIYAQAAGTGKLFATGGNFGAGIGGDESYHGVANCGAVTINGGFVVAKGGNSAAGIGGGDGGSGGTVTVNGGIVLATGSNTPYTVPGIGAGHNGAIMGTLTVADGVTVGAGQYLVNHDGSIAAKTPVNGEVELAADAVYYEFEQTSVADAYGYVEFSSDEPFSISASRGWDNILKYSTDTETWSYWFGSQIDAALSQGRYRIYFRGIGNSRISNSWSIDGSDVSCEGNIDVMRDYAGLAAMGSSAYNGMFDGCTALASAPTLPATNLTQGCYRNMFRGCTSLTVPPALPATALAENCYYGMFSGCTSLTTPPALPATTLAESCYREMFDGCTSLNMLPVLPATVLAKSCYYSMFYGCSGIKIYYSGEGIEWSIPETAVEQQYWNLNMFNGTTGDLALSGPEIGVTYIVIDPVATEYAITYMDGEEELTGLVPATYLTGEGATLPTAATVKKSGMLFTGWHMLSACTDSAVLTIAANDYGNKTFYASWVQVAEPEFTIVDGKLTAVDLHGNTEIIIPDDVYDIGMGVFGDSTYLESVMIPTTVTNIGQYAFHGCTALKDLTIPGSVEAIGMSAFWGCTSLTNLTLVEGVKYIDEGAFWHCSSLTNGVDGLYFPDSIVSIGDDAFYSCGSLTKVSLPGSMYVQGGPVNPGFYYRDTEVMYRTDLPIFYIVDGSLRLANLNGHTEIVIPETVKEISGGAFEGQVELQSVTIPSSVTNIMVRAFTDCTGLSSVTMSDGLLSIGGQAFYCCTALKQVTIPDSVTTVDGDVFWRCTSLEEATVGSGVTVIPEFMFAECTSLTNVILTGNVTEIGHYAFSECSALQDLALPDSLEYIARDAFRGCSSIKSVTIPARVRIDSWAFEYCTSLEELTIGVGCTIEPWAFIRSGLKSVNISGTVVTPKKRFLAAAGGRRLLAAAEPDPDATSVGDYAFYGCSGLESALIGRKVNEIGGGAFGGCTKLKSVTVEAGNENYSSENGMLLKGGTELISAFGTATSLSVPAGVTKIDGGAFAGYATLTSVTLPSGLTTIGEAAFSNATHLATATIPQGVGTIGSQAFHGTALKTVCVGSSSYVEDLRTKISGSGYDTAGVTFVAPTESMAPVTDEQWLVDNDLQGASEEDVAAAMLSQDDNGLSKWQNYVLNQDADEPVKFEGVQSAGDDTTITVAPTFSSTARSDTGYTVEYSIDTMTADGTIVSAFTNDTSSAFAVDLSSITSNAFFKVKATLKSETTDEEVPVETENTIGVLAIKDAPQTTVIGVPFKSLSDDGSISVSDLVHTANLSNGTRLQAFEGNTLHSWTLTGGVWVEESVFGPDPGTGGADKIKLDRGKGVWLTRVEEDLDKPIYLIGEASDESVETELDAPDEENGTAWTLVASPSVEPVDVADIVGENTGDRIILPADGFLRNYSYKNGEWGYDGNDKPEVIAPGITGVRPKRITGDNKIPAGRGFWYLNKDTGSKTINW